LEVIEHHFYLSEEYYTINSNSGRRGRSERSGLTLVSKPRNGLQEDEFHELDLGRCAQYLEQDFLIAGIMNRVRIMTEVREALAAGIQETDLRQRQARLEQSLQAHQKAQSLLGRAGLAQDYADWIERQERIEELDRANLYAFGAFEPSYPLV
jgi:hypothetical protein